MGVPGVDIDVIPLSGGGNPHELNDGTDASGNFTTTIDQGGVFEVRFYPPSPPTTTLLTGVVTNVVVVGTKNMGVITLSDGVLLEGQVGNSLNQPVGGVKVEVFDQNAGSLLALKNNSTSAFGTFKIAVPTHVLELRLGTKLVIGQTLAPITIAAAPAGATDLGAVILQPGFHLTGTVKTSAGVPIANANIDVEVTATGVKLYTPGDNTTALGLFDVVVPAGTLDVIACPPAELALVATDVDALVVSAATNVGILTMVNGVVLSGTVRDWHGNVVLGADVNVNIVSTGQSVTLCGDNTNAAGFYSVLVPLTVVDVQFSPPKPHTLKHKDIHQGVSITGATTLNGSLPHVRMHTPGLIKPVVSGSPEPPTRKPGLDPKVVKDYEPPVIIGLGVAGSNGSVPRMGWTSQWLGGFSENDLAITLDGGRAGAPAYLLLGLEERPWAAQPTVHFVHPLASFGMSLNAFGSTSFTLPRPAASLVGVTAFAQFLVRDPVAEHGFALSRILRLNISE